MIHEQSELGETVQKHLLSPTLKTEVDIKVTGIIARTKLTQTFKNAGEKLVAARVKMLFKQPFFGNIACRLKLVDVTNQGWCNTAAVDGRNFYYNSDFVEKLDLEIYRWKRSL